ncbi:hypothetical protein [Oryza sativa Japonica Group]|uniref:Uncharacterized protein n=1 Tax=Oryza sativa subsp. japonica TaxID=39947 RepID=Q5N7W8_ORYSJ|nr:hypothetical protein [Oryza sativa Japonica Group]
MTTGVLPTSGGPTMHGGTSGRHGDIGVTGMEEDADKARALVATRSGSVEHFMW